MEQIFWVIVGAAIIHVIEEYFGGWLAWTRRFIPGTTMRQFYVINTIFIVLCIAAAAIGNDNLIFSLSVPSLIFINALIHIITTIRMKRYSPGVISSFLLYVPLAIYAYYSYANSGQLSMPIAISALLLGVAWMLFPLVFQLVRLCIEKIRK